MLGRSGRNAGKMRPSGETQERTGRQQRCACPLEIPIHLLTFKGVGDVREDFGVTAGMDPKMESLLSSYKTADKETFIR